MKGLVILLLFLEPLLSGAVTNYDSYKVYQVTPQSMDEALALKTFENNGYFDFWSSLRSVGAPVDIMVNPIAQDMFEDFLQNYNIKYDVLIENVQETINKNVQGRSSTRAVEQGQVSFTEFMRYDEITAYLQQLAADYPSIVTTEVVGQSFEGRDISLIRISSGGTNKTTIFAEATIHAREWIAPPVALYVISQLVENSENAYMYEDVDWAIIPVANPDGYEYTHTDTRLWRKTRTPGTICYGVDPNRNFDYNWNVIGASSWQCDETYAGYIPFSEQETQAIRDYTLAHKDDIKLYLAIHSYGQWMLYPWGHTTEGPEDEEELIALGELFRDAIYAVNGTEYVVNSTAKGLYYAAGTSIDWAKAVAGIDLSYTIELPGGGSAGFDIPAERIESVVEETWEGFKVLHDYIQRKFNDTDTDN
ncbi:carboxypeptidase B [Anoplophora glabripennis]|uniref:carboxypeptidase B n=1 Tax=Anoplophora glabripennis TaxID=217634 RepID=UPI000873BFE6|nr:carboxypeptidase B [Anoplophora glabripennis]